MRLAQGGKFEHGFMSGFVSSLAGSSMANSPNMKIAEKIALSAVIGGAAEKLGGGKFANGAVTGAYVMMFNHLAQHKPKSKGLLEYSTKKDAYEIIYGLYENSGKEHAGYHFINPESGDEIFVVDIHSAGVTNDLCVWKNDVVIEYREEGYSLEGLFHTHPTYGYREAGSLDILALRELGANYQSVISTGRTVYQYKIPTGRSLYVFSIKYSVKGANGKYHPLYRETIIYNY